MTTAIRDLVAPTGKSHRSHAIVMAAVAAVALVTASAFLRPTSSGALPAVPAATHGLVIVAPPMVDDLVIQSVGYVVFDWSPAEGGVPGFAAMPDNFKLAAN